MNTKTLVIVLAAVVIIVGSAAVLYRKSGPQAANDSVLASFAQCLTDSGAVFYGAFWCPHCQRQKALFGGAADVVPYVECATPNGQGQLPVCAEADIKNYPTWVFGSGERMSGEVPLATLAEKTGCVLPGEQQISAPAIPTEIPPEPAAEILPTEYQDAPAVVVPEA